MHRTVALVVAGIVFTIVAIVHLLRLVYNWDLTIAGHVMPMSLSVYGLIVSAILALWMFISAGKK